jgi:hypothetical protein
MNTRIAELKRLLEAEEQKEASRLINEIVQDNRAPLEPRSALGKPKISEVRRSANGWVDAPKLSGFGVPAPGSMWNTSPGKK